MSANPFNINIRNNYFKNYREFKQLKKIERKKFKDNIVKQLDNMLTNNSKEYWSLINKLKRETDEAQNAPEISIDNASWTNYFQKLNSVSEIDKSKINKLNDILADLEKENMSTVLDYEMTNQEIFKAIKKLKNGKASGTWH
jgi:tellurite resistance protein